MAAFQAEMGPNTGEEKKKNVMEIIAGVIGNDSIWEKTRGIISMLIDFLATLKPKT